ncbi:phosphodiester glycosidase family protein, partial [Candidatus Thorarchaeota archaeon]
MISQPVTPISTATLWPTSTPAPATPTPRPTDTGWQLVKPGIEVRSLNVVIGETTERVTIARLDPAFVRFRVLYNPQMPLLVTGWSSRSDAILVVNAGYYTEDNTVIGLTISDGSAYGSTYGDYAGMFAVTSGGDVSVRWLRARPYDPMEPLQAAVQSFPIL